MQQTSKKVWIDESGAEIPYARVSKHERLCETTIYKLQKQAEDLNKRLASFKALVEEATTKMYESLLEANGVEKMGKGKGNVTFYSFDRSVKIEVSVNELVTFDDNLIKMAKEQLDEFLDSSITGVESFIKELVLSAFATSRGKLDTKKILALKKHAHRINDNRYHAAMDLIDQSIRRPDSKTYFRCAVKDKSGEYKYVDLNFSSI